jgi:HSP20 family protein
MAVVRWDPFRDVMSLQDRMNRLFDQALSRTRTDDEEGLTAPTWSPAVDIFETPDSIVMKAALPGINQKEVEISLRGFMAGVIAPPEPLFSLSK